MNNRNAYQWSLAIGLILIFGAGPVHADDWNPIVKALVKGAEPLKSKRLAILLFPYANGDTSSGTSLLSQQLAALLAKTKLQIVEESRVVSVLSQIELEENGTAAVPQVSQGAKDLGVDAIVTGTLEDLKPHQTMVSVRLIRVPSGAILTEASAKIKRTWYDPPQPPPEPENPNAPYVMHASPLIYTPQAGADDSDNSTTDAAEENAAAAPIYAPVADNAAYGYAGYSGAVAIDTDRRQKDEDKEHKHDDRPVHRDPHEAEARSQFYYAAGLTLENQGHPQEAARLYASAVKESPAPSPLQTRAEKRSKQDDTH